MSEDSCAKSSDVPAVMTPERCTFCRRPFAPDEEQILHFASGEVQGAYHEWCRPDRRRSGCGASSCRGSSDGGA